VITTGGYREPITLPQIRSNLEMDSHEERLQLMIKQTKMDAAQDQARAAATTIREQKASGMVGIGGGSGPESNDYDFQSRPSGRDFNDSGVSSDYNSPSPYDSAPAPAPKPVIAKKGMSLGAKKNTSLEDSLFKEDKLAPIIAKTAPISAAAAAMPAVPQQVQHPVMLALAERVSARVTRDGTVEAFDIKGSLTLTAADDDAALCSVQLGVSGADAFTFMTHPKVNKAVYDQAQLIQLKDTNKGFPSARPVGVLRWNHSSTSDDLMPLKINCWPEEESRGNMNVSIEYSMDQALTLQNVQIRIPLGTSEPPNIVSVDGNHRFDPKEGELIWEVDMIDASNNSGSLEFNIQQRDSEAFFPINVDFASPEMYCHVEVASVRSSVTNGAIQYGLSKGMVSDEYQIV
jgi:coatomer subunit delta